LSVIKFGFAWIGSIRGEGKSELFKPRLQMAEADEAFAAFAEYRPPDFTKIPGQGVCFRNE
jgi:hypothetical protein